MKTWLTAVLAATLTVAMFTTDAEAKRLGGGKSSGMQRDMPARTAPDAAPGKPASPQGTQTPAQQAAPATTGAAAAAAPAKRSWLGPIAGLAAGLGIAALLSHLGLGEGFANILMIVLLAAVAFIVIRFLMRRFGPQPAPAASAPMQRGAAAPAEVAWPSGGATAPPTERSAPEPALAAEPAGPVVAKAFVPAAFDSESFQRVAKMIFIRLQAANDARDLEDLRSFTTPEMFASFSVDLQERVAQVQTTEVVSVDAQVLDVAQEGDRQVVSVRFTGQVREEPGAAPAPFNEVWHLVKPLDDSRSWAIAGIEQMS